MPFRSLSELATGLFLVWSADVHRIAYESIAVEVQCADGSTRTHWPDFRCVLEGGEILWVNAKYGKSSITKKAQAALDSFEAHCARTGQRHLVVCREDLEKNGFMDTIALLYAYGRIEYVPRVLARAESSLAALGGAFLEEWQRRARRSGVPVDVLYHLLFHGRLPMAYRAMVSSELILCRA